MQQTDEIVSMPQLQRNNSGMNAIFKFLVKRKLTVPPPIKKQGGGQPKQLCGRKKEEASNHICGRVQRKRGPS